MILHLVNNSGKWGNSGVFKLISSKWKQPETTYTLAGDTMELGNILQVPVDDTTTVLLMFAVKNINTKGSPPPIKMLALKSCFYETIKLAQEKNVTSIHLSRIPEDTPKLNWPEVEQLLLEFANHEITPFVYTWPKKGESKSIQMKLNTFNNTKSIFKGLNIILYGVIDPKISDSISVDGGTIVDEDDDNFPIMLVTHIVTTHTWEELFSSVLCLNPSCMIVSPQWVYESINAGYKKEESIFFIKKINYN